VPKYANNIEFQDTLDYPLRLKWTLHGWAVMGPVDAVALGEHSVVKMGEPFRFNGEPWVYGYIAPGTLAPRKFGDFK